VNFSFVSVRFWSSIDFLFGLRLRLASGASVFLCRCRFESSAQIRVLRFSHPDSVNCSLKQDSALRPGLHCRSGFSCSQGPCRSVFHSLLCGVRFLPSLNFLLLCLFPAAGRQVRAAVLFLHGFPSGPGLHGVVRVRNTSDFHPVRCDSMALFHVILAVEVNEL
jgi:hypothetical protein